MEQKHFSLLPATLAVAAALAAGTAQAETVHFDDPSRDFTTSDDGLFLATGDSTITAKDIALDGKSISASLSEGGELGAGSLAITANNARLGSYSQSLSINGTPTEASFSGKIDLSGSLTVANGVNIYLCKYRTNPALVKNKLAINATSIDISGGVVLNHETQGWNEGGVPGGLIDVRASADKIKIDNSRYWGISLGGNYRAPTDDEGVHLTLEANKMELSGGFAGPGANDIAVRVFRGAELNLLGKGERPELTITTNHIGSSTSGYFNKVALLNAGGKILVRYGEGSHLKFVGGIVTNADLALDYANSTSTTIETGPGSMFEMTEGDIAAARGPLTIRTKGSYLIDDAWISANESTLTLDLETSSQSDNGLLTGLIEMNPDGIVDLRVAGQNSNAVLATFFGRGTTPSTKLNMKFENGGAWLVDIAREGWVNNVTTLALNKGILDLSYRSNQTDTEYRTVHTETFGGAGGTVNFNLILNSSEEKNDHLLIGKMKEGDHTVHVEAHSGFEPVDMQGYLIRADEWQGGTFTADTNPIEEGVYLYSYTVAHRPGEEEGQTDWYLTFGTYVPPAPDPGPEPDPGPGPQPEPKPEPTPQPPLSPSGEAVASLAGMGAQTAMYLAQLSDVRKRLGEVRRGAVEGLWASVGGSGDHISGFRGTGFKQDAYRFNFGFDRKAGEWLLGGTLKAMTADQKTRGTQFQGKGDAHSEGFNLYATWTGENGSYADFVAGLDRYHEKLSTHMLNGLGVSGTYRNIGLGLSAEVGHQFMSKDAWFIEPQAQLSYYRLWGDDFALSNGMKVSQKNFNGLTGRLGLASGKEFRQADGTEAGQLYARLGVKHELMGDQEIHVNGIRFKDGLLGTRFYYGLGAEWLIAKNVKAFGHVERENGSRYTREFDFNLGVKYAF